MPVVADLRVAQPPRLVQRGRRNALRRPADARRVGVRASRATHIEPNLQAPIGATRIGRRLRFFGGLEPSAGRASVICHAASTAVCWLASKA
jgi:hypothetical protein